MLNENPDTFHRYLVVAEVELREAVKQRQQMLDPGVYLVIT